MANCTQCGIDIPNDQNTCSMCFGDTDHGNDNYYEDWLVREQEEREREQQEVDRLYEELGYEYFDNNM